MDSCYFCGKTENSPGQDGVLDVSECENCFHEFCDDCGDPNDKIWCNICLGKGPVSVEDIM